jgi:flagellar FliL protein
VLEEIGEEPANFGAKALDELIQLFGEHTAQDLQGTGKARIKDELSKRVSEAYHGDIVAVYFTELVIP